MSIRAAESGPARYVAAIVEERGWRRGTALENRVALVLSQLWRPAQVAQQYKVEDSRYRLDFAWPDAKIALEADGWQHQSPDHAAGDARRDSWLRGQGWLIFRVDDRGGPETLVEQTITASLAIRCLVNGQR